MRKWTIILTVLVAIETLLIIIYACGTLEVDANSPSVLISALSVLVTFVVAWQIWATITTKEDIKEMKLTANKLNLIEEQIKSLQNAPDAYLFYILAIGKFEKQSYYDAFEYFAIATLTFIENNIPYEKFSTVALSYMESCLDMAYGTGHDIEIFKNRAQVIHQRLDSILTQINNIKRFADEAKIKVNRIRSKAQQYDIIPS